jgi:glycine betaine/proline transport system ATP-binding protein
MIEFKNAVKIYGPNSNKAIRFFQEGMGSKEIFEQTKHFVALRKISICIKPSQTFVFMGLSGSGKSTLLRLINRLIDPTSGEIHVDGKNILKFNRRELIDFRRYKISMVFQHFGLFPHKTVLQNIAYNLNVKKTDKHQQKHQALHWIEKVGLSGMQDQYPHQLSGGMKQRVGLARALAADTDIILMDEPFSALDPLIRNQMQEELIRLQNQLKKTIVFITHDISEALKLGDEIAILKEGQVEQIGTGKDIQGNPCSKYVASFFNV